jgi:DNA-binding transcriptional LysR family regulator
MAMELRHLRYFLAVAECENMTRAAERLHITQPPLSRAIRELEDELGVALFARRSQRISLTEVGAALVVEAESVVERVDGFAYHARGLAAGDRGRIRVGYVDGALHGGVLATQLRNLRRRSPALVVDLIALSTAAQLRSLAHNQLDIALTYTPPEWPDDVVGRRLLSSPVMLAVAADDVLSHQPHVQPSDLDGSPWVALSRDDDALWRDRFVHRCGAAGFHPDIRYEVAQLSALLGLVEAGAGCALAQEISLRTTTPELVFKPLPWWHDTVDYWAAWRVHNPGPAVERFLEANQLG